MFIEKTLVSSGGEKEESQQAPSPTRVTSSTSAARQQTLLAYNANLEAKLPAAGIVLPQMTAVVNNQLDAGIASMHG